jgi:hypothetical protein
VQSFVQKKIKEIKKIKEGRKRWGKKNWNVKFVKFHATVRSAVQRRMIG